MYSADKATNRKESKMALQHLSKYAGNLKGVALYAFESWKFQEANKPDIDEFDHGLRKVRMCSHRAILQLLTGRNIETDEATVREIIEGM